MSDNKQLINLYKEDLDKYEYVVDVTMPIKYNIEYEYNDGDELYDEQQSEIAERISNSIEDILDNEDIFKMYFEKQGLGRVWATCSDVYDNITMRFAVQEADKVEPFDLKDVKASIKEYMKDLLDNIEYDTYINTTVTDSSLLDDDESDENEPGEAHIEAEQQGDIRMDIVKAPVVKESCYISENIDRQLVTEGYLLFKNSNNIEKKIVLSDDGLCEIYKESRLLKTTPFSKISLIRECKGLVQQGYILQEAAQPEDDEEEITVTEQDAKELDQLEDLRDEFEAKLAELCEEATINNFPSTEQSSAKLCKADIANLQSLKDLLTPEQIAWIETNLGTIELFYDAMDNLFLETGVSNAEHLISIDEYIEELVNNLEVL